MKKIMITKSNESEVTTEYHLSSDEIDKVRKIVEFVFSAPDCEDAGGFVLEAIDLIEELKELEFIS